MSKNKIIKVQGSDITVFADQENDYISLTDMVASNGGNDKIKNWIRNKNTIEYLGAWETLHNPNFNSVQYHLIMLESGVDRFIISITQWSERTNAIGIMSKAGRYGGTYAHRDIAFKFGAHLSPMFELLLIKEFQRLKEEEAKSKNINWDYKRFLTKTNYVIHTEAIQKDLIPRLNIDKDKEKYTYADEADIFNLILFGTTAKKWKEENQSLALSGMNLRDFADINQLTVLSNLQSYNSILLKQGMDKIDRVKELKSVAENQLKALQKETYTYSIESPNKIKYENSSTFDERLKLMVNTPPIKDKK
jgi:hypothetical protein